MPSEVRVVDIPGMAKRKANTKLRSDVSAMRAAARRSAIESGLLRAHRPVTVPDAKKVASKHACRGRVRIEDA